MIEKPMLFSAEMVLALLDGRKTQTRRIVNPQPELDGTLGKNKPLWKWRHGKDWFSGVTTEQLVGPAGLRYRLRVPHPVGSLIWVKETFAVCPNCNCFLGYAATDKKPHECKYCDASARGFNQKFKWKPSIFMPQSASRITLEVTAVKVERLNSISEEDAKAEGSYLGRCHCLPLRNDRTPIERMFQQTGCHIHGIEYKALWESINGPGSWALNPWVWVYSLKRIKP